MRYIIALLITVTTATAGLKSIKAAYETKLHTLQKRYLSDLTRERKSLARFGKDTTTIDAEIAKVYTKLYPMAKTYRIKYTTGIRHYDFRENTIYFREGKETAAFVRKKGVLIIKHASGSVETWERSGKTWKVIFRTPEGKNIRGEAVAR